MKLGAAWERDSVRSINEVVRAHLLGKKPEKIVGHGWEVADPAKEMAKSMDTDTEGVLEIARVSVTRWRAEVMRDIATMTKKAKDKEVKVRNLRAEANAMQKEIDDKKRAVDRDALGKIIAANMKLAEDTEQEISNIKFEIKELKAGIYKDGDMTREKLADMVNIR